MNLVEKMAGVSLNPVILWIWILMLPFLECKICLKNDVIGYREGNLYTCNDPEKQDCCERDKEFTCCVPTTENNVVEQLQLWGSIALMISVMAFVYLYYAKDREIFRRETLQLAVDNFLSKFRFRRKKPKSFTQLEESNDIDIAPIPKT
ncbi:hypothetical protein SNE40_008060 [Patella caerulea]|uniref:Uncharacterized protein n=1 Tax=Patella caerulea TaxID=87958 RepID=A0AAN8K7E0_PATCE